MVVIPIKDIEERRRYQRDWIAKRRAEFFQDKSCVRCGSVADLELDHINPADKVAHAIWSWSAERREAEIAKCQVLCHDCHQGKSVVDIATMRNEVFYRHGTYAMYNKHGCRCGLCTLRMRNKFRDYRERDAA